MESTTISRIWVPSQAALVSHMPSVSKMEKGDQSGLRHSMGRPWRAGAAVAVPLSEYLFSKKKAATQQRNGTTQDGQAQQSGRVVRAEAAQVFASSSATTSPAKQTTEPKHKMDEDKRAQPFRFNAKAVTFVPSALTSPQMPSTPRTFTNRDAPSPQTTTAQTTPGPTSQPTRQRFHQHPRHHICPAFGFPAPLSAPVLHPQPHPTPVRSEVRARHRQSILHFTENYRRMLDERDSVEENYKRFVYEMAKRFDACPDAYCRAVAGWIVPRGNELSPETLRGLHEKLSHTVKYHQWARPNARNHLPRHVKKMQQERLEREERDRDEQRARADREPSRWVSEDEDEESSLSAEPKEETEEETKALPECETGTPCIVTSAIPHMWCPNYENIFR